MIPIAKLFDFSKCLGPPTYYKVKPSHLHLGFLLDRAICNLPAQLIYFNKNILWFMSLYFETVCYITLGTTLALTMAIPLNSWIPPIPCSCLREAC